MLNNLLMRFFKVLVVNSLRFMIKLVHHEEHEVHEETIKS
jgi:hypothetical protein